MIVLARRKKKRRKKKKYLLPVSQNKDGMSVLSSLISIIVTSNILIESLDVTVSHLRIVDVDIGPLGDHPLDDGDGGRVTDVTGVGLEGETEDDDLLSGIGR